MRGDEKSLLFKPFLLGYSAIDSRKHPNTHSHDRYSLTLGPLSQASFCFPPFRSISSNTHHFGANCLDARLSDEIPSTIPFNALPAPALASRTASSSNSPPRQKRCQVPATVLHWSYVHASCISSLALLPQVTTNLVAYNHRNVFSHFLEARNSKSVSLPKSRCQQGRAPSGGSRKQSISSLPPCGGCRPSLACGCITPATFQNLFLICLYITFRSICV